MKEKENSNDGMPDADYVRMIREEEVLWQYRHDEDMAPERVAKIQSKPEVAMRLNVQRFVQGLDALDFLDTEV